MSNELNELPYEGERALDAWACAWYAVAIAKNFARWPCHPDDATVGRLQAYFHAGRLPAEGAKACFGIKH
jgi:hypothetical protein